MVKFKYNLNCSSSEAVAVLSVQGVTGITVTVGADPPAALIASTVKI
jgi:hypothetical protein